MDEGEQLQQIEAGQFRIAEPVADQRRIQQDHRRFGGARDRLPPPHRLDRPVRMREPDAAVGCVQRGIGQ